MAFNPAEASGYQSTYGAGLGGVQAYGYGNPYGPYAGLNKAPGVGGTSSSSSTSTPAPANTAAMNFLNSVVSGGTLPYGQQQQDAMFGQASGMNAAAEASQNSEANDSASTNGASPTDPSLQNQFRQNAARRQTGNQRAMGEIQSKAGSANFGAQANAAGELMNQDRFNQDLAARQSGQAMSMLSQRYSGGGRNNYSTPGDYGQFSNPLSIGRYG